MSVSINSADNQCAKTDFPLLQCFAMTPFSAPVQRHYVLLGGREGVLLSSCFFAPEPVHVNPHELSGQARKNYDGGVLRPTPILTKQPSALPPLKDSTMSPKMSPLHMSDYKSSSGSTSSNSIVTPKHAASTRAKPALMSGDSFHGSAYQEPLVDFVLQEMQRQSPPPQHGDFNVHALIASGGAGLDDGRCIKKTVSEDDVTQSELSHIMHYYDHLIGDGQSHGTHGAGNARESGASQAQNVPRSASGVHSSETLGSLQTLLHGPGAGGQRQDSAQGSLQGGVHPADRAATADSECSTEFADIVGSSTLDPQFWQAAQDAKSTYSFRRIKLKAHGNKHAVRSPQHAQYQLTEDFTIDTTPGNNQVYIPGDTSHSLDQSSVVSYSTRNRNSIASRGRGRGAYVNVSERAENYARIAKLKSGAKNSDRPSTTLHAIRAKAYTSKAAENAANNIKQSGTAYQKNTELLQPL